MHPTSRLMITIFIFSDTPLPSEERNPDEQVPEEAHQISASPTPPPVLSMVELFNQRRQKLIRRKLKIAELSNSILENPEGSVSTVIHTVYICSIIIVQCKSYLVNSLLNI